MVCCLAPTMGTDPWSDGCVPINTGVPCVGTLVQIGDLKNQLKNPKIKNKPFVVFFLISLYIN